MLLITKDSNAAKVVAIAAAGAAGYWATIKVLRRLLAPRHECDRVLVGLPYSHFVEQARWAMERRGLRVREVKVPIGPHAMVVPAYRLLFKKGLASESSYPGQGFRDSYVPTMTNSYLRRLAGVPLVVNTRTDTCLADSWSVMEDCQLAVNADTKQRFDKGLGPDVRQVGYYYVFKTNMGLYRQVQSSNKFFMFLFDVCESVMSVTWFMKRLLYMEPKQVEDAMNRIRKEFKLVSSILEEWEYLGDGSGSMDSFGGADISFSALAAWLILPDNLSNGQIDVAPKPSELAVPMQDFREELLKTKAGQHLCRCYDKHRKEVAIK